MIRLPKRVRWELDTRSPTTNGNHYADKQPLPIGSRSKSLLNRRFRRRISAFCSQTPTKVLEIGAGHGFFADACSELGDTYVGIEPNPLMFDLLSGKGLEVHQTSCPPIPFPERGFDLVYAGYVVEYLPSAKAAFELMREIRRVLRPGGVAAIVSSDYMRMKKEFWNVSYLASFATSERRLKQLFYDAELEYLDTIHFAGNLFGVSRYLAYLFYSIYSYRFFETLFRQRAELDSRFYKLRVTFSEGLLAVARRP